MKKYGLIPYMTLAGIIIFIATFASFLTPCDPYEQNLEKALMPPNAENLLGTDIYGRDLLSRVIAGATTTVLSSLMIVVCIFFIGGFLGAIAGLKGGRLDSVIMRTSDIFLAFPQLVFAIAMSAALGGGLFNAALSIITISWTKYARLARSLTLSVRELPFISAAKISGATDFIILKNHILPNIAGTLLVTAALDIGTIIAALAGLSFLGLGAKPPEAEWGQMLSVGRNYLQIAPLLVFAPGAAIFVTVAIFNMLGDKLRDVLDRENN